MDLGLKAQVCQVVAQMLGGFINRPQIFWQIFTDLLGGEESMIAKKPKNKFVPKRGEEVDEAVNKRMHERKKVSEKYLLSSRY